MTVEARMNCQKTSKYRPSSTFVLIHSTAQEPKVMKSIVGIEMVNASKQARANFFQRGASKVHSAPPPSKVWRTGSLIGGDPNQVSPSWINSLAGGFDLMPMSALAGISEPGGTTALLPTKTLGPVLTGFKYIQPLRISSSPSTTSSAMKFFSPISTRS